MLGVLQQLNNIFIQLRISWLATPWRVVISVLLLTLPMNPASSQTGATNQHLSRPVVIELSVTARDDIPSRWTGDPATSTGYPGWIENNKLILHPEAARQVRWKQSGRSIIFSGEIKTLKDARYVFVERPLFQTCALEGFAIPLPGFLGSYLRFRPKTMYPYELGRTSLGVAWLRR